MTQNLLKKSNHDRMLISVSLVLILFILIACDDSKVSEDIGIFNPNEGIGGFANAPYEEEGIHPTEVGWTRQSRFKGPDNPIIDWTVELPGRLRSFDNAPIIDVKGNIYFRISEKNGLSSNDTEEIDGFYAYDSKGNQLWKKTNFHEEYGITSGSKNNPAPMLNNNGQLLGMLDQKTIGAFDKTNGEIQFVYQVEGIFDAEPWYPTIGEDGTIYFVYASGLYALTPEGEERWVYRFEDDEESTPSNGGQGSMPPLCMGYNYLSNYHPSKGPSFTPTLSSDRLYTKNSTELMAFDLDGNKLWKVEIGRSAKPAQSNIIIDSDDHLYFIHGTDILSYTADGKERWRVTIGYDSSAGHTGLGLSKDGTLVGLFENGMHAFDTDGNQLWHNGEVLGFNGVTFDSDGTIYFTAYSTLYAMAEDGELQWELNLENSHLSNPVIGPNQKIYLLSDRGFLTIVGEE